MVLGSFYQVKIRLSLIAVIRPELSRVRMQCGRGFPQKTEEVCPRPVTRNRKNYSNKSHLDFIERYVIIGPANPKIAVTIPNPIARFIINAITALTQNA